MSSSSAHTKPEQLVVAVTRDEDMLKAVELRKDDQSLEVLWVKSTEANGDWSAFAAECGVLGGASRGKKPDRNKIVTVGFGSAGVAFYHIEAPAIDREEAAAIVKMQVENLLPLPADQIEVVWRTRPSVNGKAGITLAAAKKELLQKFVESVRCLEPRTILLNCEAVVKAWRAFFGGDEKTAVVVSLGARNSQVCLAEDGQLSSAVVLDVGMEDFPEGPDEPGGYEEGLSPEQAEAADRFCKDMGSVLESFGLTDAKDLPIVVLSGGSSDIERVVAYLKSAGMNAASASPELGSVTSQDGLNAEDLYEYRVPLGLAAMAVDDSTEGLKLFESLYVAAGEEKKKGGLYSRRVAGAIAAVMLVALLLTAYLVDAATYKRLSALESQPRFKEAGQRYELMKIAAQQRPDLMELLSDINSSEIKGITLDSLWFRKGQLVTITGQAQSTEQTYEFQKYLLGKSGIKEVNLEHPAKADKDRKVKFTMKFHYKQYTKKNAGL